ncbi:MAG: response regulator, partial [Bermanella sp.]
LLLEDENYQVFQATDGLMAKEIITNESIDLMISDILMPGMDGLELCSLLESDFPDIPIILISGGGNTYKKHENATDDLLNQAQILTQAKAILKKPFSTEELLIQVKIILEQ